MESASLNTVQSIPSTVDASLSSSPAFPNHPRFIDDHFKEMQNYLDFSDIQQGSMVSRDWKNRFRTHERGIFPDVVHEIYGDRLHGAVIIKDCDPKSFPNLPALTEEPRLYKGWCGGYRFIGFNEIRRDLLTNKIRYHVGCTILSNHPLRHPGSANARRPDAWKFRYFGANYRDPAHRDAAIAQDATLAAGLMPPDNAPACPLSTLASGTRDNHRLGFNQSLALRKSSDSKVCIVS